MNSDNWLKRLKSGLAKSSSRIINGIADACARSRLDAETIKELEDVLISADLGPSAAERVVNCLAKQQIEGTINDEELRILIAEQISNILAPAAAGIEIGAQNRPHVVLVVGVNGTGKTTTIGKLARQFTQDGLFVLLAAGDTFRAAAIEQLEVWGERTGCDVISEETGSDASGLIYNAVSKAIAINADVLLIDTAGRLHNKDNLMAELEKIQKVIQKLEPSAPHEVLLVLDATTGQNALSQVETFLKIVSVTGLIVTKLDGTAKGGILVALADRFGLPVRAIGIGEGIDDLRPFSADDFAYNLLGLDAGSRVP